MSVPVRLAAFVVALAAAFGGGFGIGEIVGPFDDAPEHDMAPAHGGTVNGQHDREGQSR